MGGKSGGGGPTETTVTNNALADWQRPYYEYLSERGTAASVRPYQQYRGQRVAGFNPAQQFTQQQIMGMQRPGVADQATGTGSAAANRLLGNAMAPSRFNTSRATQYMNPYMSSVTDQAKRESDRGFGQQVSKARADAAGRGTLGGYRNQLQRAEMDRNQQQQLTDIEERGLNQAYERGIAQFNTDRTDDRAGLQAGMGAAGNLMQLGTQGQELDVSRFRAQGGVGDTLQTQEQKVLSEGVAEYDRQMGYEDQQLNRLNAILRGMPISQNSTVANYGQQGNSLLQGLGAVSAGYGMYNQMKG